MILSIFMYPVFPALISNFFFFWIRLNPYKKQISSRPLTRRHLQVVEEERIKLQADVDLAAARLMRAGKLTQALADEKTRWEDSVKVFMSSL